MNQIYELRNYLTDEFCDSLIQYHMNHDHYDDHYDKDHEFYNRLINPCTIIDKNLHDCVNIFRWAIVQEAARIFGERYLFLEWWSLAYWGPGMKMEPHADKHFQDGSISTDSPNKDYSCVCYLNDNYDGGETYFTNKNVKVKPEKGKALFFPGTLEYTHGVKEVTNGHRYTLALWFTRTPTAMLMQ